MPSISRTFAKTFLGALLPASLLACIDDPASPRGLVRRDIPNPLFSYVPPPDSLHEPNRWAYAPHYVDGPFLRGIVDVQFHATAGGAARTAALDSVSGTIIGQIPLGAGEPFNIVRLPSNLPDSAVFQSITILKRQSAVKRATAEVVLEEPFSWSRPNDGSQWTKTDWQLRGSDAYGGSWSPRWALEAVHAPLAWGCSVGSSTARVAVIDIDGRSHSDLSGNLNSTLSHGLSTPNLTGQHGTAVMSVLAARGNNDIGMTGGAWQADLRYYETGIRDSTGGQHTIPHLFIARLHQALTDGARVINVSLGTNYDSGAVTAARSRQNAEWGTHIVAVFEQLDPQQKALVVVSAGNGSGNAYWSTMAAAFKDSLPAQSVVVTASNRAGALATYSNIGSRVDVAAPGDSILAMRASASDTLLNGASFATAMVSALGTLLVGFDSTLSADALKAHIINGAIDGGVTASRSGSTYPVVDYYASLRRAGRRMDGPICGGIVTVEDQDIVVYRDSVTRDVLAANHFSTTDWYAPWARHGGHHIDFTGLEEGRLSWMGGSSWASGTFEYFAEGSMNSVWGYSHDWTAAISGWCNAGTCTVEEYDAVADIWSNLGTISVTNGDSIAMVSYPMVGDTALVMLNRVTYGVDTRTYHSANVYKMSLTTGNEVLYWADSTGGVTAVGLSEDGKTMVVHRTSTSIPYSEPYDCTLEYRRYNSARSLLMPAITTRCVDMNFSGQGAATPAPRIRSTPARGETRAAAKQRIRDRLRLLRSRNPR